ncbi:MAG: hypothetical protein ACK5B9_03990 [Flavobacteriia bacterium]|jgi:hypothetical protein
MRKILFICLSFCFSNGIFAQLDKQFFTTYQNSDKSLFYGIEPFNSDFFSPEELPQILENEEYAFTFFYQEKIGDEYSGVGVYDEKSKSYKLLSNGKKLNLNAVFKANKGRQSISIKDGNGKNQLFLNELKTGE